MAVMIIKLSDLYITVRLLRWILCQTYDSHSFNLGFFPILLFSTGTRNTTLKSENLAETATKGKYYKNLIRKFNNINVQAEQTI